MTVPLFAVSKHEAAYVSGTTTGILKDASGTLSTQDRAALLFHWESDKGFGDWTLPYDKITRVTYSQQGRGRGSSVALGVSTLGVGNVLSRQKRHFVTFSFVDQQGQRQNATFEVGKDVIRDLLSSIEKRTGKKVHSDDEDSEGQKTASKLNDR